MKHLTTFIFLSLFINHTSFIAAQNSESYTVISKIIVKKKYQDVDIQKWKEIDGDWLYNGQKIGISPLFYIYSHDTIHTVEDIKGIKQLMCKTETKSSTGYYTTQEPDWEWNKTDTTWYYKNTRLDTYPRTFTKIAIEITENSDCSGSNSLKKTIRIEEDYNISSPLWTWDAEDKVWLYENHKTPELPHYTVERSIKKGYIEEE